MKLVVLTAFIAVCGAAKLDRGYLPPASARTAGGNAEDLQTPIAYQSQGNLPKGGFTNEFQGVVVDAVAAGTRSSDPNDSGLGAPRPTYGSQDSKVGSAAFRLANQESGNQAQHDQLVRGSADAFRTNSFGTPSFPNSNSHASATSFSGHGNNFANQPNRGFGTGNERTQAAQERSASTLRFESEVGPESFNYAFETDNGISAEESAVATNGVQAQGAFSYTGDDGQVYSVTYTADEGGYQPKGEHLPTPPPIPEEILKSLEQNAKDEAAGLVDDGSYDARKYNEGADYTESSGDNGQYQHGTAEQQGNNGPSASSSAYSRQSSSHGSQTYATANSGQSFNAGSRQDEQNSRDNFGQQGKYNSNKPESLGRQPITHNVRNNQYNNQEFNVNQGQQNLQGSQEINRQSFDQSNGENIQATSFSEQGKNGDRSTLRQSSFGQSNLNQNSGTRTQADSFTSQGQSVNKQAFGQASFGQTNDDNINNNDQYNGQRKETLQHTSTSHEFNRQYSGQHFGGTNRANGLASQGQNGNRQAFSQASFGQSNSYDSTGAPSTDSGIIKNKFNSQQLIQQNRFGQNQKFVNSIHNGNRHQYLPPVSQNSNIGTNSQHLGSEQTINNLQFGATSAESPANAKSGVSNQLNKYSTSHTEVPKFGQTTSPSGFQNNFAESTATFGIKRPTNKPTDAHLSSDFTNFPEQSKFNKGSAEFNTHGSNSQIPIPINHQSSAFGSASFGAQQSSGNINSRFNIPATASSLNYESSSAYNQQTNKFESPSDTPQTIKNSAQASSQFDINPANNAHGLIQQKYSTNTEFNSQQNIGQFGHKQFNMNDQSNNTFISSTEKPLLNPSSAISQASLTTQKESYQYSQPPKNLNSPINTQFDSTLHLDKQNEFNSQSQFGTTPTFQAFPTQQSFVNRFSSSNSKISGKQNKFPQQFNSQGPFFQAQPQSVAQASAQIQSNRQSQGFQKQTTAIPQQFQPLRQPFGQTQQATASAQFNKASSQISPSIGSPNLSGTSGTTAAIQQYNGEIYEYNKPAQSLPAPNQKDQDGSSTQVSSQSSFGSSNQSFKGTQSQLTGSSVSGKGEIFGGPRKPPSFNEHSGYHY